MLIPALLLGLVIFFSTRGAPTNPGPSRTGLSPDALNARILKGADILGYYTDCPSDSTVCEWNARVPSETLLTRINIPGTHDTVTWNYTEARQAELEGFTGPLPPAPYFWFQNSSIFQSLNLGIRAFDLRYGFMPDSNVSIGFWHGMALQSPSTTLEDVFYGFYKWLDEHPSETVIISLQVSHGLNDAQFQELTYQALNTPTALQYWLQTNGTWGTLGEARGKLLLIARFDWDQLPVPYDNRFGIHLSPAAWTDNSANISIVYNSSSGATAFVEDYYEIPVGGLFDASPKIEWKFNATKAHLELADSGAEPDRLFVTFASAEDTPNGVTPRDMALGNVTDGGLGMNQLLLPWFQENKGKRHGLVFFDFFDEVEGLVEAFLGL